MYLTEYQKVSIDNFMGLWNRGSLDDVPPDHASDCLNVAFARKREVLTRPGSSVSRNVIGNVIRQFIACFDNQELIPLRCDGAGNIYRDDTNQPILSIPGMIDMDCLNMNNHVFIAPMMDSWSGNPYNVSIYVWTNSSSTPRLAAGTPPEVDFNLGSVVGGGHTGPGWYGVSVSWVTDTGFVTSPAYIPANGGWPTVYLPDNTDQIVINDFDTIIGQIPANSGVTSAIIWVTQGQQDLPNQPGTGQALAAHAKIFQYIQIPLDQATSPYYIDFYDTDLTISADALPANGNVLNILPYLPSGIGLASIALAKYHGRLVIIGTTFTLTFDPNNPLGPLDPTSYPDDRVWISNSGSPETFDQLTGYIKVQSEFDGNSCRTAFELFGVLYICKAIGTFATQDSGGEPNDPVNPWIVNMIDGGIGAYHHAVGTISGSQPSLSFNSTGFLANRNGLFLFNGNVLRPELTWKIRAVWGRMTHGSEAQIRVAIDIYNDLFYVLIAADGNTSPSLFLMGDYSLGLDSQNIRWTIYEFPYVVYDIMMGYYGGDESGTTDYYLRIGSINVIFKLDGARLTDVGTSINNYYQLAPLIIGDIGSLNIYRFIRYRMAGTGTLYTTVADQGEYYVQNETSVSPQQFPGNYKDIGIQVNFTNEKAIVRFGMNATTDCFRMARVDVFGKQRWPTRPNG